MVRAEGRADAGGDGQIDAVEGGGLVELVVEPSGCGDVLGVGDAGQQDGELVAAQAGEDLPAPEGGLHALGDFDEQLVAVVVAEGV